MKPCQHIGCNELVKSGYCDAHNQHKVYNRQRTDVNEVKFYSSTAWKRLRELKKQLNPLCERCEQDGIVRMATTVHHKVEVKRDWNLRLKLENLESICDSCHKKVHGGGGM